MTSPALRAATGAAPAVPARTNGSSASLASKGEGFPESANIPVTRRARTGPSPAPLGLSTSMAGASSANTRPPCEMFLGMTSLSYRNCTRPLSSCTSIPTAILTSASSIGFPSPAERVATLALSARSVSMESSTRW